MTTANQGNSKLKTLLLGSALMGLVFAASLKATAQNRSDLGLFLEPAVTYELGGSSANYPSPLSNSNGDVLGVGLGVRLGIHVKENFFLGADGRYSIPKFKDSSVDYQAKSVSTNWGPAVGMQMPDLGVRLWGAYIYDGSLDPERSGSFDVKFQGAEGVRLGAGFRVSAVSVNIEYQEVKYDNTRLEEVGPFSPGTDFDSVRLENKSWIASVSFPLEL